MAVEYLEVVYSKPRGILEELGGGGDRSMAAMKCIVC